MSCAWDRVYIIQLYDEFMIMNILAFLASALVHKEVIFFIHLIFPNNYRMHHRCSIAFLLPRRAIIPFLSSIYYVNFSIIQCMCNN